MKINGRGQAGYSESELVNQLRINPDTNFTTVCLVDASGYNRALADMFSELPPLDQWQDCECDWQWHRRTMQWGEVSVGSSQICWVE